MSRALARTHALFGGLLAVAVALRVITLLGYPGVAWFGDSGTYLRAALDLKPSLIRPSGYSVFLFVLRPFHSMIAVTVAQQLLGLATGVLIYLIVRMKLETRWAGLIGTLAAAPVLLDAYQLQLEHLVMADCLFTFLLVATVYLVMRGGPMWAAGAVLAVAALTRSVGLPFLLIFLVYLLVRRAGLRKIGIFTLAFAVPMIGYVLWFHADHKTYSLTRTDQIWLYGRTVDFADCSVMKPRAELLPLCPDRIIREPGEAGAHAAIWGAHAPLRNYPGGVGGVEANKLAGEFARLAIEKQPLDYAQVVTRDTWRAFAWSRTDYPDKATVDGYRFPAQAVPLPGGDVAGARQYGGGSAEPRVVGPFADWARWYQSWAFVPGTVLGLLLLAGLAGMVRRRRDLGGPALLPWALGLGLLVVPAGTADFDYRYVLPAVPLAALATALAWAPRPEPRAPESDPAPETEAATPNAA